MKKTLSVLVVAAGLLIAGNASATWDVWLDLQIDGTDIEGESPVSSQDRENKIHVSKFKYEVVTPREEVTGRLTGRRVHKPITITKKVDKSSPLIFKALCLNEPVNQARFRFFRKSASGTKVHYQTILIEDAYVSGYRQFPVKDGMMEEITFVFANITITYEENGATHMDDMRGMD